MNLEAKLWALMLIAQSIPYVSAADHLAGRRRAAGEAQAPAPRVSVRLARARPTAHRPSFGAARQQKKEAGKGKPSPLFSLARSFLWPAFVLVTRAKREIDTRHRRSAVARLLSQQADLPGLTIRQASLSPQGLRPDFKFVPDVCGDSARGDQWAFVLKVNGATHTIDTDGDTPAPVGAARQPSA